MPWDFPGGTVVKTFTAGGMDLTPSTGNKIPHAPQRSQKNSYASMPRFSLQNTHLITLLSILTSGNSVCRIKCKLLDITHKVLKQLPMFIILSPTLPLCVLNKHFCQKGWLSIEDTVLIFICLCVSYYSFDLKKSHIYPLTCQFKGQSFSKASLKLALQSFKYFLRCAPIAEENVPSTQQTWTQATAISLSK